MVPIFPEISFATGAITSHEVEAETKSVPGQSLGFYLE